MFSLFSVVTFPNRWALLIFNTAIRHLCNNNAFVYSQCSTASANSDADMKGVCLTKEECDNKGGSSDGNCAYG